MSKNKNEALDKMVEKILFNKDHLAELKSIINNLKDGNLNTRDVRAKIIMQKSQNLEKLLDLIPFFIQEGNMNNTLKKITEYPSNNEKLVELQEKNDFLEKVGIRVNYLVNKLSKKLQG